MIQALGLTRMDGEKCNAVVAILSRVRDYPKSRTSGMSWRRSAASVAASALPILENYVREYFQTVGRA